MAREMIGQILKRMGKLSEIDIDEILAEQIRSRRRFGEIALDWGLCEPENILDAWCSQLTDGRAQVDIGRSGVDLHAVMCIPAEVAQRLKVMPLRVIGNELVVAAAEALDPADAAELAGLAGREIRFVRTDARQVQQAFEKYYPKLAAA